MLPTHKAEPMQAILRENTSCLQTGRKMPGPVLLRALRFSLRGFQGSEYNESCYLLIYTPRIAMHPNKMLFAQTSPGQKLRSHSPFRLAPAQDICDLEPGRCGFRAELPFPKAGKARLSTRVNADTRASGGYGDPNAWFHPVPLKPISRYGPTCPLSRPKSQNQSSQTRNP